MIRTARGAEHACKKSLAHRRQTNQRFPSGWGISAEQKWDGASAVRNIGHDLPIVKKTGQIDEQITATIETIETGWSSCSDCVFCSKARQTRTACALLRGPLLDRYPVWASDSLFAQRSESQAHCPGIVQEECDVRTRIDWRVGARAAPRRKSQLVLVSSVLKARRDVLVASLFIRCRQRHW